MTRPAWSLPSIFEEFCEQGFHHHDWVVSALADPEDPTEHETHICSRCGLRRESEWGTLPTYWRKP